MLIIWSSFSSWVYLSAIDINSISISSLLQLSSADTWTSISSFILDEEIIDRFFAHLLTSFLHISCDFIAFFSSQSCTSSVSLFMITSHVFTSSSDNSSSLFSLLMSNSFIFKSNSLTFDHHSTSSSAQNASVISDHSTFFILSFFFIDEKHDLFAQSFFINSSQTLSVASMILNDQCLIITNEADKDKEKWLKRVNHCLHHAWASNYFCDRFIISNDKHDWLTSSDFENRLNSISLQYSLAKMTAFWHRQLLFFFRNSISASLHNSKSLQRDNQHDDFTFIQWKTLLIENDDFSSSLSFRNSKKRFLAFCESAESRITWTWDVDSFLAHVITLTVHKDDFQLMYRSFYLRRITQNQRVLFNDYAIHKLKQLQIEHDVMSERSNYNCHLILSHMSLNHDESIHLRSVIQIVWINEIVLLVLRVSCFLDILQHYSRSFVNVMMKITIKKKIHLQDSNAFIDLWYIVSNRFLHAFWTEILQRCNWRWEDQISVQIEFRNSFLIIIAHDLKLQIKHDIAFKTWIDFVQHLQQCFHWHLDNFSSQNCWLDFENENIFLTTHHDFIIILLWKIICLRDWSHQFCCLTHVSMLIITQIFLWALTCDISTASMKLRESNDLRHHKQMIFHKMYSLHKDLWVTSMKKLQLFKNIQLEALKYSQTLLNQWYAISKQFNSRKWEWLIKILQQIKNCINVALFTFMNISFNVQQEYCIQWDLFQTLNLDHIDLIDVESTFSIELIFNSFEDKAFDIKSSLLIQILRQSRLIVINSSAQTVKLSQQKKNNRKIHISSVANHEDSVATASSHKLYWVLFTKKVNLFIVKELNWWLFCVKILMSHSRQGSNELQSASEKLQLINEIMISALIQTLRLSLDVNDSFTQSTMWRKFWKLKERQRKNWSLSCNSQFNWSMMLNLNFQTFLDQYDLIWFLRDLIE